MSVSDIIVQWNQCAKLMSSMLVKSLSSLSCSIGFERKQWVQQSRIKHLQWLTNRLHQINEKNKKIFDHTNKYCYVWKVIFMLKAINRLFKNQHEPRAFNWIKGTSNSTSN